MVEAIVMRGFGRVLVVAGLLALPARALAHPDVEAARAAYGNADFDPALEALARAESATELTRDDLIELLLVRALVHFAMGATAPMQDDVARLAVVAPGTTLPPEVPPTVRAAFEAARTSIRPLGLDAHIDRTELGAVWRATLLGDPRGLVRRTELGCRVGGGPWQHASGGALEVTAQTGDRVSCWARVIGLGGATIVSRGSETSPIVTVLVPSPTEAARAGIARDEGGVPAWPFIVGGTVAVAVAVLVIVLVATAKSGTIIEPMFQVEM